MANQKKRIANILLLRILNKHSLNNKINNYKLSNRKEKDKGKGKPIIATKKNSKSENKMMKMIMIKMEIRMNMTRKA